MSKKDFYLSSDELSRLIKEVECKGLTKAPPDICYDVVSKIRQKKRDLIIYSLKVAVSTAACVGLVFSSSYLPSFSDISEKISYEKSSFVEKSEVLSKYGTSIIKNFTKGVFNNEKN